MTKNDYYMYKQAQMDFSFMQPAPDDPNVARFYLEQQGVPMYEPPKKPSILERLKNWFKSKKTEAPEQVRPEDCIPLPADAWHGGGIGM